MKRFLLLLPLMLVSAACDVAPSPKSQVAIDSSGAANGRKGLSATLALAEIYGNVDPATDTAVWTRPDPEASEPASFDSVDGITTQVSLVSLTPIGPDRALVITAAQDENGQSGAPKACADCAVLLSVFSFERDSVGWRVVERRDGVAQTMEKDLTTAINLLLRSNGSAEVTLAGTRLMFDASGKLVPMASK